MKNFFGIHQSCGAVVALWLASTVPASSFDLDWSTIDGGANTSAGGAYIVSGTTGQSDAGQLVGGGYALTGGFWGIVAAIQTEGAPLLTVSRSGGSVVVKWPFPSTGFVLQQTTALVAPPSAIVWTDVTSPAAIRVGSDWTVTIPAPAGNRFFRAASACCQPGTILLNSV